MNGYKRYIAAFAEERDLLGMVAALRERHWPIVEAYTPYPVHGLDEALGRRRSYLSVACLVCGLVGVALALSCQVWTTAWSWPLNVGGQPWNSLPAFVPVIFEVMVLFAGLGLFVAWLLRCGLYPGKQARLLEPGQTDNRFVLVIGEPGAGVDAAELRNVLQAHHVVCVQEQEEGGR
jgi:hypothetical protein